MRRLLPVLFVTTILGLGIAIGLGARALVDSRQAGPGSSTPVAAPAADPAARSEMVPPPATATPRPAPTATAVARDVVMEVTEAQLESQLSSLLVGQSLGTTPLGEATVQSVSVQLRDSQIQVGGGARAGILQAPFLAAGTVMPDGSGRPVVKVNQASVGGVDLPAGARFALAESLQGRVDDLLGDGAVKIRTIDIANGKMRVVGTAGS